LTGFLRVCCVSLAGTDARVKTTDQDSHNLIKPSRKSICLKNLFASIAPYELR
jgi:hypothetical protein